MVEGRGYVETVAQFAQEYASCLGCQLTGWPHIAVQRYTSNTVFLAAAEADYRGLMLAYRLHKYHGVTPMEVSEGASPSGIQGVPILGPVHHCIVGLESEDWQVRGNPNRG